MRRIEWSEILGYLPQREVQNADHWVAPGDAEAAMRWGTGRGVKIAILDSGVEWTHPDLEGARIADDVALVENDGAIDVQPGEGIDVFGHGTAVAGIVKKLAPDAEIGSFRVLDGNNQARSEMICEGARLAIEQGYHILNCSFGARLRQQVLMYKNWVDMAYLRGVHVVAACNNDDFRKPEWPGDFSSVITVHMTRAAQEADRQRIFRNVTGTLVEYAAWGVDVEVPWKGGGRLVTTGSSFAAPRMTGLIARLLSFFPGLSPWTLKAVLHGVAKPHAAP